MPGVVKVGCTNPLPEDRAKKLRTTGVPMPFVVEFGAETSFPEQVEKAAHAMLAPQRESPEREFFRVSPDVAIEAVRDAMLEVASIKAWGSEEPHLIRHDDRIALTTKVGDVFAVLACPDEEAKQSLLLDLWTAHADGDLLELFGAPDLAHVAGISDHDPQCGDRPGSVPRPRRETLERFHHRPGAARAQRQNPLVPTHGRGAVL
jgi:hypothetical protein